MKRVALLLLVLSVPGVAAGAEKRELDLRWLMTTDGFMEHHPDLRWRRDGLLAYQRGEFEEAFSRFERAARFGDKPSQAMIADMYWRGVGVEQNRPLAYAWIDLSAERAYPDMIVFRERYWNSLTEEERSTALQVGQSVYARYGDAAAKARQSTHLRRGRSQVTGSRTGFIGTLSVTAYQTDGTSFTMRGDEYYAKEFWVPAHYWALQDRMWSAPVHERVRVGDPETVGKGDDRGD